jgi:predicted dehydrogenase
VLCEKPLAMSAAEAAEMAAAADAAGVRLAEAFMYRHHPTWVEASGSCATGAIGELQSVQSWFSYFNDDPTNIRNRPEHGGGAVMDIGCYSIHLSRLLFGAEPTSVQAAVRRDPQMGIDTLSSALLEFPGGGQATFTCSIRAEPDQRVHIVGSRGPHRHRDPVQHPAGSGDAHPRDGRRRPPARAGDRDADVPRRRRLHDPGGGVRPGDPRRRGRSRPRSTTPWRTCG